jgi:hypothetical protein
MNFGTVTGFELVLLLAVGFLFRVVPIVIAVWLLVVVHRLRRRLDTMSARLDELSAPAPNSR